MSERTTGPSRAFRLVDILSRGWEPAPAGFFARRSYYPWLVVGTTCIATFNGQLDASIVQLALPALEHQFQARLSGSAGWPSTINWPLLRFYRYSPGLPRLPAERRCF